MYTTPPLPHASQDMTNVSDHDRCYLLKLAPEVRLLIWEQLWPDSVALKVWILDTTYYISPPNIKHEHGWLRSARQPLAALLTCKTIHAEAQAGSLPILRSRLTILPKICSASDFTLLQSSCRARCALCVQSGTASGGGVSLMEQTPDLGVGCSSKPVWLRYRVQVLRGSRYS